MNFCILAEVFLFLHNFKQLEQYIILKERRRLGK